MRVIVLAREMLVVMALTVVLPAVAVPPSLAQDGPSAPGPDAAPELPAMTSAAEVRAFVARLSDAEARRMLLALLDAAAQRQAEAQRTQSGLVAGMHEALPRLRQGLADMAAAVKETPAAAAAVRDRVTGGRGQGTAGGLMLKLAGIFGGAAAAEWLFRRLLTGVGPAPAATATASFIDKLSILGIRLIAEILSIAVFAVIAIAIFFVLYTGHEPLRVAFVSVLWAVILPRAAAAAARFAVAPRLSELRLVRVGDRAARALFRGVIVLVAAIGVAVLFHDVLVAVGLGRDIRQLYGTVVSFVILSLIIVWIWWWRRPISRTILEGGEPGVPPRRVRQLLAANWHVFATCFIAGVWMMSTIQRILTENPPTVAILVSLGILFAIPVADAALTAAVSALLKIPRGAPAPAEGDGAAPEPAADAMAARAAQSRTQYGGVLVRNLRIVLLVIAIVILARVWDIDMQSMAASGVGETIADALWEIIIALVLASAAWGIVKTAIANAVPRAETVEMEGEIGGTGRSRSETLLPLVGNFILVAIVVVTVLVVLSALGVAIGPLIAGAGVVGIAIGFGAQTLVRDILSGIFFLIDDAFRTGEYIDTGSVRGTVEHISIRSLRLRHHRGPLHTIPFGEIQHLTNFSRDWAIEKLELRVPYDTDLEKVRKIIKTVGRELMEHPEHGPNFIQPLKSQGVNRMDDSAFIVRVKFMAKPGQQFVLRREVFRRIQQAFTDNGIHFAPRRVIVETASPALDARAAAAAVADGDETETRRGAAS